MQLRTEVQIDAPPEKVWAVLTDFARYPEWNPFIQRVEGELREGKKLSILLTPPDGSEWRIAPVVLRADAPHELRWRGKLWISGLFDGEHYFVLEAHDGGTRLVHAENFSGLLKRFMGNAYTQAVRGFVGMNQALKRRVEASA